MILPPFLYLFSTHKRYNFCLGTVKDSKVWVCFSSDDYKSHFLRMTHSPPSLGALCCNMLTDLWTRITCRKLFLSDTQHDDCSATPLVIRSSVYLEQLYKTNVSSGRSPINASVGVLNYFKAFKVISAVFKADDWYDWLMQGLGRRVMSWGIYS